MIICAPAIGQTAALGAVRDDWDYPQSFHPELLQRRSALLEGVRAVPRLHWRPTSGAFFGFVRVDGCTDSAALAESLLDEAHVVTIPGSAFGEERGGPLAVVVWIGQRLRRDRGDAQDRCLFQLACGCGREACRLSEIIGHRRLVALLSRAVAQETLPAGPAFCRAPRCRQAPHGGGAGRDRQLPTAGQADTDASVPRDACGTCASCRRIARGVHPDVLDRRARRARVDQDRAGPRRDRSRRLSSVRGPAARGDRR